MAGYLSSPPTSNRCLKSANRPVSGPAAQRWKAPSTRFFACRDYPLLTRRCRRSVPSVCPTPLRQVHDWTGEGPRDAVHCLHACHHQLAELVEVACLGADDHVVGAGDGLGPAAPPGWPARAQPPCSTSSNDIRGTRMRNVPKSQWAAGRAWHGTRLLTRNSMEVIRPTASWAYASGQRKHRLDGHLLSVIYCAAPRGRRGWTGKSGLEFLPEGPTGPDGEPLGGGWRHPPCGGEVQAAFGPWDEALSSETREGRGSSSGH